MKRKIIKALAVLAAFTFASCSMFTTAAKPEDSTNGKEASNSIWLLGYRQHRYSL